MLSIRPIQKFDNDSIKEIILSVLDEHGAVGGGFAGSDPELNVMYETYNKDRHSYYVLERDGTIVGGAGIAPLAGADNQTCELQKMYFLKEARGQGFGLKMIHMCLLKAKEFGYKSCYLETLTGMDSAQALYQKVGFKKMDSPMGNTGHFGCNTFYCLDLLTYPTDHES